MHSYPRPYRAGPWWAGLLACLSLVAAPARAHEPLWGETPTVFGFGILHPELKLMYYDAGSTRRGGQRMRMFEQEYMIDYAPSASINLRLEIPYYNNLHEARSGGQKFSSAVTGLGDITLRAKRRFSVRQGEGLNVQHALLYGLKLPTGRDDHEFGSRGGSGGGDPGHGHGGGGATGHRRRLDPHDQTGTGNPGLLLGYAWDRETLEDTVWASTAWTRDLGGGFRMGDMVNLDVAYGRWLIRPNEAAETGFNLAFGLHGEFHRSDPLGGGRDADNSHRILGFHLTPIITKGTHQFRIGVFVPVLRGGAQDHTDYPYEVRFAYETFF
jgi:hypothetical protein